MSRDDDLWTHALRASLDAVVLQFEAQVRSHVAHASALAAQREESLRRQLAEQGAALAAARAQLTEREAAARSLDAALQREAAECARLRAALQQAESAAAASAQQAQQAQRDLGALGEQFAAERDFARAAKGASGTILGDALDAALGCAVDASPTALGALKSRRPDAVLAAAMRERGRTVARAPLSDAEREALAAMARAAGCELVEVEVGARYVASGMEKVGTRAEPAEEDHVLACAMPGLRLGGASGAAVQPRVIVGTA